MSEEHPNTVADDMAWIEFMQDLEDRRDTFISITKWIAYFALIVTAASMASLAAMAGII